MKRLALILTLGLTATLSGCAVYEVEAHGRTDFDADVRVSWGTGNYYYDSYYGVYVSYGYPGSYWMDGYYYYFSGSHWMRANHWHGPWLTVAPRFVPTRVHGYRSHVYRHADRYPRVKLSPKMRYDRYSDRHDGHLSRDRDRYSREYHSGARSRDEKRRLEAPQQRPFHYNRPAERSQKEERRANYREERTRNDNQATAQPPRESRAHKSHRDEPKAVRQPKKVSTARDGNQRSRD